MKNGNIVLRYIKESDIDNYVRWTTVETEWQNWDAPWEWLEDDDFDFVGFRRNELGKDPGFYSRLEIETTDGDHVGWVSCYNFDYEGEEVLGVGLDIPATGHRGKGLGQDALTLYMAHLFGKHDVLYTQTWSGNSPMIRLAEKIGFAEVRRLKDIREVRGKKYDGLTFSISKNDFFKKQGDGGTAS